MKEMNQPHVNLSVPPLRLRDLPHLLLMFSFVYLTASHFQVPWILESFEPNQPAVTEPALLPVAEQASPKADLSQDAIEAAARRTFLAQEGTVEALPAANASDVQPDSVVDEVSPSVESLQPNT